MAEKDTVFSGKVKHSGMFKFKGLYEFLYDWLNQAGYSVTEKSYSEEISGDSKKIDISWEAKRTISDYFKFSIKVGWIIVGLKDVEVQREGKKIKTNSGTPEISVKAVLIKDYESKWEDAPIWKFLRGVYERYIIKSRIDDYEDKLTSEAEEFISEIKAFLVLESKK